MNYPESSTYENWKKIKANKLQKVTLKYIILRRLIDGHNGTKADLSHIYKISRELSGKTIDQLKQIHFEEFGY